MLLDKENQFSSAQTITTGSDTGIASTNVIDFSQARDIGAGQNLYVVVTCTTAMTDSGSNSTLEVRAQTDDNEAFSSATTSAVVGTFPALSAIGTKIVRRIDPGMFNERYGRLFYISANGALSTGAFSAHVVETADVYTMYPDAITIS